MKIQSKLICSLLVSITLSTGPSIFCAVKAEDDPFIPSPEIQTLHNDFNISHTMAYLEDLEDGDIVVWGPSTNNYVVNVDYYGLALGDIEYDYQWSFFKIHRERMTYEEYEPGQLEYEQVFRIEELNPYMGKYDPSYVCLSYDTQNGYTFTHTKNYADASFFTAETRGSKLHCITWAKDYGTIVYNGTHHGEENWSDTYIEKTNRVSDIDIQNDMGFFKLIPAKSATYYPNGAEGNSFTKKTKEGQKLESCAFVKEGYCFVGWNTQADGKGQQYGENEAVTLTEDIELYAQWSLNPLPGYKNIKPLLSLAYKYTNKSLDNLYHPLVSAEDVEQDDSIIITTTINGQTYAMDHKFVGQKVEIVDGLIKYDNIEDLEFFACPATSTFGDLALIYDEELVNTSSSLSDEKGTIYFGGSIGTMFTFVSEDTGTYLANDEEFNSAIIGYFENNVVKFCFGKTTLIGTENFGESAQVYCKKNNPFKNVDFRVRVGLDVGSYVENMRNFVGKGFESQLFTSFGFTLEMPSYRNKKTYDFVTSDLVYTEGSIQYVNLILGDCLSSYMQYKVDVPFIVTPFIVYDGETLYSPNAREFTLRSLVESYYLMEDTKDIVEPLYNVIQTIPEKEDE